MIDFIRSYHNNKTQFEETVLSGDFYENIERTIDPNTYEEGYPITCSKGGLSISIDEYRAYINCSTKMILYNFSEVKLIKNKNLSYSDFRTSVDCIDGIIVNDETCMSGVSFGFTIPTHVAGKDIIKMNLLMHKYNHCNHDLVKDRNVYLKEFVYHNYKIGFYADNKGGGNFLKVILKLNKSLEFRKFGINNVDDLIQKKGLTDLFNLLIRRFDELILVDSFEPFEGKDNDDLQNYLSYSYWTTLSNTKSRQTKSRHKKKFEGLITKYNLDSQKVKLKQELNKAFIEFISN
jgi:hypothetical protein